MSFIVSDVVGDNLEIIASGPTVMDSSSINDCLAIIKALSVEQKMPVSVMDFLSNQAALPPLDDTKAFSHVQNILIGSNKVAINAAYEKATELGFDVIIHSTTLTGEAREVGRQFQQMTMEKSTDNRRLCILAGGETTVRVKGSGIGGRNQELALSTAIRMFESNIVMNWSNQRCPAVLLSAGTDGQDGPTPAAGAFAYYGQLCNNTINSAKQHLENNNSYTFFSTLHNGDDLLMTGLTNTNVMDIQILLIDKAM